MPTDYTKHSEGVYVAEVLKHELGEKFGDDYFIVHLALNYKDGDESARVAGDRVTADVRLDPAKMWKLDKWLKALGYTGRGMRELYEDSGRMFTGKEVKVQCSHSVSKKTGNKNEFWDLPSSRLNALGEDKKALWDELLSKAQGSSASEDQPELSDDPLPF